MLDHIITEPICEYFSRKRGDRDARALTLQNVAEVFKVRVAAADGGVFEFEGRDVGSTDYFVVGVHGARGAVRLGISDLFGAF